MSESPNSETVPAATESESDGTSPRVLVEYTIYRPGTDVVDHVAWEAVQPQGVIDSGRGYEREVIGFAEFPRHARLGRFTDAETFTETIEEKARYVHWKTSPPS